MFDKGDTEDSLLFVCNFCTTLAASGMLEAGAKYQHIRTIVHWEVLRQFGLLYADIEGTETLNVYYIIGGLAD